MGNILFKTENIGVSWYKTQEAKYCKLKKAVEKINSFFMLSTLSKLSTN